MKTTSLGVIAMLLMACSHKQQVKTAAVPQPAAPPPVAKASVQPPAVAAVSPNLDASANLLAQCKLAVDHAEQAPKFDFDTFDLETQDRDVLQQVATCITTGPLAGRKLALVGRADPRGTEEYNLGLGSKRAHTVASYLEQLGVRDAQLAETTRGAIDAKGKDDSSWQLDRRVDLDLAN